MGVGPPSSGGGGIGGGMGGGIGVMITSCPASVGAGIGVMTSDGPLSGGAGIGVGVVSPQPARPIASANAAVRTSAGVEGKGVRGGVKGESGAPRPRSSELLTRAKIAATVAEGEAPRRYIRAVPMTERIWAEQFESWQSKP